MMMIMKIMMMIVMNDNYNGDDYNDDNDHDADHDNDTDNDPPPMQVNLSVGEIDCFNQPSMTSDISSLNVIMVVYETPVWSTSDWNHNK